MKFIGVIIQRFNLRNHKAAQPYTGKIKEIKDYIETDFLEELTQDDMVYDIDRLVQDGIINSRCLGEIPEFGALIQRANEAITKEDMGTVGNVYESMEEKRKMFDEIYDTIVKAIMGLI